MRTACGEITIRDRKTWILLDREEQLRRCLIEPSIEKMCEAYCNERRFDADARAEAQRGLGMLDPEIRLARPRPEDAAGEPALREMGLIASARSSNAIIAPMSSPSASR